MVRWRWGTADLQKVKLLDSYVMHHVLQIPQVLRCKSGRKSSSTTYSMLLQTNVKIICTSKEVGWILLLKENLATYCGIENDDGSNVLQYFERFSHHVLEVMALSWIMHCILSTYEATKKESDYGCHLGWTKDSISEVTRRELRAWYERMYTQTYSQTNASLWCYFCVFICAL